MGSGFFFFLSLSTLRWSCNIVISAFSRHPIGGFCLFSSFSVMTDDYCFVPSVIGFLKSLMENKGTS
ncbi:unnamed protein product [Tuber melanosporum]|uniref:(Perigord truffle) hypothetical protein n=1 Tax=Tuber melanosporum (strain Mel28) TaxID=656061 RepID=D5GF06_TUBMM|nr:uncharacterized protein GSTUM_00006684001 [Tuber melanosporum]CAZ83099.1 unnamed protein product [Tuber melanosporum]